MLGNNSFTHVAYTDETNWNDGRFRGIACVSAECAVADCLTEKVEGILEKANASELSWKKINGHRKGQACIEAFRETIGTTAANKLRVDVLLWDTEDSRHKIRGRNDINNIERMYHHLLINVLHRRWSRDVRWGVFPDEQTAFDWERIQYYLEKKTFPSDTNLSLFKNETFNRMLRRVKLVEKKSHNTPLIQVADIFCGIGRYSAEIWKKYTKWEEREQEQTSFLESIPLDLGHSEKARFPVIRKVNAIFKEKKLGVSLSNGRFETYNPDKNPVNFWWWKPQGDYDKAPTKGNR